ncbi:hypothetical protein [Ideonella dechloratans]|uniref:hypothetical protein n=1 Tax=Ideonella dechloratans TaxID=36863 RepID=UPI0035AF273A
MKPLILTVVFVIGLINASFVGVVVAELAESRSAGALAAFVTMALEALVVRQVRKAITQSSSAAQNPPGSSA